MYFFEVGFHYHILNGMLRKHLFLYFPHAGVLLFLARPSTTYITHQHKFDAFLPFSPCTTNNGTLQNSERYKPSLSRINRFIEINKEAERCIFSRLDFIITF